MATTAIGRLSAILSLNASQFHAGMDKAQKRMGAFRKSMNAAAKRMVLPVAAAGVAIVKASADIEKGMIGIQKTTGLSDQEIKKLKGSLLEFSTQNNVTQKALLETAKVAGQMGIQGQEAISKFTQAFAKLEQASDRTVAGEEGAQAFSKFLDLSRAGIEGAEAMASALVELGNTSKTTEGKILDTATEIVKKTSRFELGGANILGFATALDEAGVQSEVAGSTFQKFFENLDTSIKTGGESLDAFSRVIGKTPDQIKQAFSEDPSAVLQSFLEGLNRLNTEGADTAGILKDLGLGGLRASSTLQVLADRHQQVSEKTKAANDAQRDNVALQNESAAANRGVSAAFGRLWNQIKKVADAFASGSGLNAGLVKVVDTLNWMIGFLPKIGRAIVTFTTDVIEAFVNMKDNVVRFVKTMVEDITKWFTNPLEQIKQKVMSWADTVSNAFKGMWEKVTRFSYVPDMIRDIGEEFSKLPDIMVDPAETSTGMVTDSFRTMRDSISTLLSDIINGTKSFGESLKGIFSNIAGSVVQSGIDRVAGAITEGIAGKFSGSSGFLAGAGKALFGGATTSSGAGQAAAGAFTTSGAGGSAAAFPSFATLGPQMAVLAAPFIARELVGGGNLDKEFAKFQGFSGRGALGTQVGGAGGTSFAGGPASGFAREFAQGQGVTAFTSEGSGLTAFKTDMESLKGLLADAEREFESLKKSAAKTFDLGEKGAVKVGQAIKDGVVTPTEFASLGMIELGEKITHAETGVTSLGEVGVAKLQALQSAVDRGTFRLEALRGETRLNQREIQFLGQQGLTAAQLIQGGFDAAAGGVRALRDESVSAAGDMANAFRGAAEAAASVGGATFGGDPNSARDQGLTQQLRNDSQRGPTRGGGGK